MILLNKSVSYKASYYEVISYNIASYNIAFYKNLQHYPSFTLRTAIMNEQANSQTSNQSSHQNSNQAVNQNNNQNINQFSSQNSQASFDSKQTFADIYQSSIDNREQFWAEQ